MSHPIGVYDFCLGGKPMGSWTGPLGLVETPQEHDRDGQEPEQNSRFAWASDDVIELE